MSAAVAGYAKKLVKDQATAIETNLPLALQVHRECRDLRRRFHCSAPEQNLDLEALRIELNGLCREDRLNFDESHFRSDLEETRGKMRVEPGNAAGVAVSSFRRLLRAALLRHEVLFDPQLAPWTALLPEDERAQYYDHDPHLMTHGGYLVVHGTLLHGDIKMTAASATKPTYQSLLNWERCVVKVLLKELDTQ